MRLTVLQRGARAVHDVEWTMALGGSAERVERDGDGEWRGQFTDHGTHGELRIADDSLPTTIDGRSAGHFATLAAGMEIGFGEVRILVEYDGPLEAEPPLSALEGELLQRIAEGDDTAAVVLADHWGDARGAFITAQRAGVAVAAEASWLANLRTANFAGACAGGFAVPLALDATEPLEVPRISPRTYRIANFAPDSMRTLVFAADGHGPLQPLGRFALKVPHSDRNLVDRAEAFVRMFDHPHVVRHAGSVQHRRGLGFAMPWAGVPLDRRQFGNLALALAIGRQMCAALRHLAAHGVAHRAIDPTHILLLDGHATLVGFGSAEGARVPPADDTARAGTGPDVLLRYWAPEYLSSRAPAVVTATDLFALAGLLVEIATGTHPYGGYASPMETLAAIVGAAPPLILGDSPLERLARATLVLDPAARPTLDAFEAAL